MDHPAFILLFQEKPPDTTLTPGAATTTATATREEPDTDIGAIIAATQTFTEAGREEPDADPRRIGMMGGEPQAIPTGTATRTDSREEPDQDRSFGSGASACAEGHAQVDQRVAHFNAEHSFLWLATTDRSKRLR